MLTLSGLVTYYVLFFIHLESRRVDIAGITVHPDEAWMKQMARNVTMKESLMVWRAWCWAAHWPRHELTPWEPGQVDGYCHCR